MRREGRAALPTDDRSARLQACFGQATTINRVVFALAPIGRPCYTDDRFRPRGRFLRTGNDVGRKTVVFVWSLPATTTLRFLHFGRGIADFGLRIDRQSGIQSDIRGLQSAMVSHAS